MSKKILGVQCQKCKKAIPLLTDGEAYCPECGALMVRVLSIQKKGL